jgi:hypothetical protein
MNFQACLENTFRMIKAEPIILILGGLVVQLLTILTMGILAGPFLGGYFLLIIYYLRENRKPVFNDIFSGLQQFANLLPYFFVLLTILIGFMLLILPGFVLATWWIYVLPLMVDRKISFSEAMKISTKKVNETGFLMHLAFLLLITVLPMMLLNFLSAMMPFLFVLKLLLPPFQVGCLASLYVDQFKEIEEETAPIHMRKSPQKPFQKTFLWLKKPWIRLKKNLSNPSNRFQKKQKPQINLLQSLFQKKMSRMKSLIKWTIPILIKQKKNQIWILQRKTKTRFKYYC